MHCILRVHVLLYCGDDRRPGFKIDTVGVAVAEPHCHGDELEHLVLQYITMYPSVSLVDLVGILNCLWEGGWIAHADSLLCL